jgi:hypothetical protein
MSWDQNNLIEKNIKNYKSQFPTNIILNDEIKNN